MLAVIRRRNDDIDTNKVLLAAIEAEDLDVLGCLVETRGVTWDTVMNREVDMRGGRREHFVARLAAELHLSRRNEKKNERENEKKRRHRWATYVRKPTLYEEPKRHKKRE